MEMLVRIYIFTKNLKCGSTAHIRKGVIYAIPLEQLPEKYVPLKKRNLNSRPLKSFPHIIISNSKGFKKLILLSVFT